jgi:putative SOS response-associated peptidase YedK
MTSFYEPIYTGALAGNMVEFRSKAGLVVSPGLWDEWVDHSTGEVIRSFAIITDEPLTFVGNTGHDRSPVFFPQKAFDAWLDPKLQDEKELKAFLRAEKFEPELTAVPERPLKDGWQKNAPEPPPDAQLTLSFDSPPLPPKIERN